MNNLTVIINLLDKRMVCVELHEFPEEVANEKYRPVEIQHSILVDDLQAQWYLFGADSVIFWRINTNYLQ